MHHQPLQHGSSASIIWIKITCVPCRVLNVFSRIYTQHFPPKLCVYKAFLSMFLPFNWHIAATYWSPPPIVHSWNCVKKEDIDIHPLTSEIGIKKVVKNSWVKTISNEIFFSVINKNKVVFTVKLNGKDNWKVFIYQLDFISNTAPKNDPTYAKIL